MPFTVNVGSYRGGDYLASGLSNLGQGIAGGISDVVGEQRKRERLNDDIVRMGLMQGKIAPEEYVKYRDMNGKGKDVFVANVARGFADDFRQKQQMDREAQAIKLAHEQAQTGLLGAQTKNLASDTGFTPQIMSLPEPGTGRQISVLTQSPRSAQLVPPATNAAGQPVFHPQSGEVIGIYGNKGEPRYFKEKKETEGDDFGKAQVDAIDAEIAKHKVSIAQGQKTFHNPNAWFDFAKPRADRIAELERAKAALAPPNESEQKPVNADKNAPVNMAPQGKVLMRSPDGRVGLVPQEQSQSAVAQGYIPVQQ